jgi:hypothetical protein
MTGGSEVWRGLRVVRFKKGVEFSFLTARRYKNTKCEEGFPKKVMHLTPGHSPQLEREIKFAHGNF